MNQPELGKKIVELRKAKGLTQEELVEKCNLSVRTLQRIEAGEVTPRSYTLKLIFAALDYNQDNSSKSWSGNFQNAGFIISNWLEQFYRYVFDLFNLKTNTMKKVTILSITILIIGFGLFTLCSESKAQTTAQVRKTIEESEKNIARWANNGQVDSILTMYREDACLLPSICGKNELRENFKTAIDNGYKVIEVHTISVSVGDSIAVEKYYNISRYLGVEYKQKGLTEWRLTKGKWLIVNDIFCNE